MKSFSQAPSVKDSSKTMATFGSQSSTASTVGRPGISEHSTVTLSGTPVNCGADASPTVIVCEIVAVLPQSSAAVHVLVMM